MFLYYLSVRSLSSSAQVPASMSNSINCYALIHLCAILAKMSIEGTQGGILSHGMSVYEGV